MKSTEGQVVVVLVAIVLIIATGIILSNKGKPYNIAIITTHKLLSLAAFVLWSILIYHQYKEVGLSSTDLIFVIISVVLFLSAFVTGGLLTVEKPLPGFITIIHKLSSGFAIVACILLAYWFLKT